MAEELTPAVYAKWDGRLSNWALCFGGPRGSVPERSEPVSDAYEALDNWREYATDFKRDRRAQAAVWEAPEPPGISIDALDTNALVILLDDDLYDAVDAYWHMSGPVSVRAAGICVSVATLYRRRDLAVLELERLDWARRSLRGGPRQPGSPEVEVVVRRTRYVPDEWAY